MRLFKFCSVTLLLITNNWLQRTLTLTFNAWVIDLSNRAALHNERGFKERNILVHSVDCSISRICLKFIRMCCWEEVYLLYQPGLILKGFFLVQRFLLDCKGRRQKAQAALCSPCVSGETMKKQVRFTWVTRSKSLWFEVYWSKLILRLCLGASAVTMWSEKVTNHQSRWSWVGDHES